MIAGTKVKSVTSGDTFLTKDGLRIRLADVNASERRSRGGLEAKCISQGLILGKTVTYREEGRFYGRVIAQGKVGGRLATLIRRAGARRRRGRICILA